MPESVFNKAAGLRPAALLKKRLWHRFFPVSFAKFPRTPFYRTPLDYCFCPYKTEVWITSLIENARVTTHWSQDQIYDIV